jgi:hypothetical protein
LLAVSFSNTACAALQAQISSIASAARARTCARVLPLSASNQATERPLIVAAQPGQHVASARNDSWHAQRPLTTTPKACSLWRPAPRSMSAAFVNAYLAWPDCARSWSISSLRCAGFRPLFLMPSMPYALMELVLEFTGRLPLDLELPVDSCDGITIACACGAAAASRPASSKPSVSRRLGVRNRKRARKCH